MKETPKIVTEELALLKKVADFMAKKLEEATKKTTSRTPLTKSFEQELIALRDQAGEARLEDVPAIVAQMLQVSALLAKSGPRKALAVDPMSPYFGRLTLEEKGKTRDVLIGKGSFISRKEGVVIVDWRDAPISQLYYRYEEGDEFEEMLSGKMHHGLLKKKRALRIQEGELKRIFSLAGEYLRNKDGWTFKEQEETSMLKGGSGVAVRPGREAKGAKLGIDGEPLRKDKHLSEITALIDAEQFAAMTQSDSGPMVIQGGAGTGKTTILLHRMAYLNYQEPKRFRPKHMMVVVLSEALAEYTRQVLPSLGLPDIKVNDYKGWLKRVAPAVADLKGKKWVTEATPEVAQLKKHPHILKAIKTQIQNHVTHMKSQLAKRLKNADLAKASGDLDKAIDLRTYICPALLSLRNGYQKPMHNLGDRAREIALRVFKHGFLQVSDLRSEWEDLIGDHALLEGCLQPAAFGISPENFRSALRHIKKQLDDTSRYDGIDADRLMAKDNQSVEDDEPNQTIDPHDGAIIMNLCFARWGALRTTDGRRIGYDHIAVDEAQDLSAVEIAPLYACLKEPRSLTLAGDLTQKVVFDNAFHTWEELLDQLNAKGQALAPFRLAYRSTKEVSEFAHEVLGPLLPENPPMSKRSGAPVEVFSFHEYGEEVAFLQNHLKDLMAREPLANVALLTRFEERSDFYYDMLRRAEVPFLRRAHKSTFAFAPGIDVTTVAQAKGLEFDYVVLLEVDRANYPETDECRHLLHIGATRAAYQLWVTTNEKKPSPLLPKAL